MSCTDILVQDTSTSFLLNLVHNTNTAQWSCEKWTSKMCWTANQTKLFYFFLNFFHKSRQSRERWKEPCVVFCSCVVRKFCTRNQAPKIYFPFPTNTTFCFFQSTNIQLVQINNRFCLSKIMSFRLLPRRTAWGIMGMLF